MLDKGIDNIKLYNNEENKGVHASRLDGINNAKGKYLLLLDQDDEVMDDFLYNAYTSIDGSDVLILNGYRETESKSLKKIYKTKADVKRLLHKKSFFVSNCQIESPGHCLIKKQSIPKEWHEYIMKTNCSDDLFLWILMVSKGCSFKFSNNICYTHRYTGDNLSLNKKKRFESDIEMLSYLRRIDYIKNEDIQLLEIRRRINGRKPSLLDKYSYIYVYYVCMFMCLKKLLRK